MTPIHIIFFGSSSDSVIILQKLETLHDNNYEVKIAAVVTQPPKPVGRKQVMTPTPVATWAKERQIAVLTFPTNPDHPTQYQDEQAVIDSLEPFKADLIVSASYGQKIPFATIRDAKFGGLNVHPSLLPRWRGADPVPWAILSGDHQTGASLVTLTEQFDDGKILAQKKIAISDNDTTDELRAKLFMAGADLLAQSLPDILDGKMKGAPQDKEKVTVARRLSRQDGFVPWEIIKNAMQGNDVEITKRPPMLLLDTHHISVIMVNALRALNPWPGVWTTINPTNPTDATNPTNEKRLKILACHAETVTHQLILDSVQLEGKKPVSWEQFTQSYPVTS